MIRDNFFLYVTLILRVRGKLTKNYKRRCE